MIRLKVRGNIPFTILIIFILAIAVFLAASCVPEEKETENVETGVDNTLTGEAEGIFFTGYYIEDNIHKLFKKSPGGEYYILHDKTGELIGSYHELAFMKAEPVYIIIRGNYTDGESGLLVLDDSQLPVLWRAFTGEIDVAEIVEIDYVKRENPIFPFEFRCYGEEPFWALDIIRDNEAIFKDIGRERVYYLAYKAPVIEEDIYRFELGESIRGDENMLVVIECGECVDSMSGEVYEYKVTIEFEGMTYEGCGEAGAEMGG